MVGCVVNTGRANGVGLGGPNRIMEQIVNTSSGEQRKCESATGCSSKTSVSAFAPVVNESWRKYRAHFETCLIGNGI
jgi:hypothetical protein